MLFGLVHPGGNRYKYTSHEFSFGGFVYKQKCEKCGRSITEPKYFEKVHRFEVDGGKAFPDRLPICSRRETTWLILSKRALDAFEADGITGIEAIEPVIIEGDYPDKPEYFIAHVGGRVDFSFKDMFLKKKRLCPECGQFDWNRQRLYPVYLDLSTWNGEDICRITSVPGHIICSGKVRSSVRRHKLKGFVFEERRTVSGE